MHALDPRTRQELCSSVNSGLDSSWELPSAPKRGIPQTSNYLQQCRQTNWLRLSVTHEGPSEPILLLRAFAITAAANGANSQVASAVSGGGAQS